MRARTLYKRTGGCWKRAGVKRLVGDGGWLRHGSKYILAHHLPFALIATKFIISHPKNVYEMLTRSGSFLITPTLPIALAPKVSRFLILPRSPLFTALVLAIDSQRYHFSQRNRIRWSFNSDPALSMAEFITAISSSGNVLRVASYIELILRFYGRLDAFGHLGSHSPTLKVT